MTTETAQNLPVRPQSQRQLSRLVKPLVDVLSDPTAQQDQPTLWAESYVELARVLNQPGNWEIIHRVQPDAQSNYFQHDLGAFRMKFLRVFHEQTGRQTC